MYYELNFDYLIARLSPRLDEEHVGLVNRAYQTARAAHSGQVRDEGTPYIVHPVRVAVSLVDELELYSPVLVCSALLHDVIEDTDLTRQDIVRLFGEEIAEIVWLLTKREEVTLREYLACIETAADTGATIVKLCDRLDNLRSVVHTPKLEKKLRYIRTTEEHYLPLAARTNRYLHNELRHWLDEARNQVESLTAAR